MKRKVTSRELENEKIKSNLLELHSNLNGIYGYRRMTMNINRILSGKFNTKRIYRLMRKELNILSVIRRKKKRYIKSSAEYTTENILNREFSASTPKEKLLTDITEFKYGKKGEEKKAFLCAIYDVFDNSIISYKISKKANTELVMDVLAESLDSKVPIGMLHSDRGTQFTSLKFKEILSKNKVTHSMSRAGKCIDNGPMEGFFGILKSEKYHLKKYMTLEELRCDIIDYIRFYNEERLQKNLEELSPLEYRKKYAG